MAQQMDNSAWIIIITLLFMALAGFQDDYLKIKGHENKGLSPQRKALQPDFNRSYTNSLCNAALRHSYNSRQPYV